MASWIGALDVNASQDRASLRRALELQRREDRAVAAAAVEVSAENDAFFEEVIALLQARQR